MEDLDGFGPHLRAEDALRLASLPVIPVVDDSRLIGVVRRTVLLAAEPDTEIGDLTEAAPHAGATDAIDDLVGLDTFFEGAPVPVVDRDGKLVGGVQLDAV